MKKQKIDRRENMKQKKNDELKKDLTNFQVFYTINKK